MAKRAGAYKSEKRKKELMRLKKQEEKRQKRFGKSATSEVEETPGPQDQPETAEPAETTKE